MQDLKAELLRGLWYVALPGAGVRSGRLVHKTLLGEPVLIGRGDDGRVFALRDICPHRGIPLHYGRFDGETIACCYHGWRFDTSGACVEIPSLREGQQVDLAKIRCGSYPCVERQGVVWIYFRGPTRSHPSRRSRRACRRSATTPCPGPRSCSRSRARPTTPPSASWTRPCRLRAHLVVVQEAGDQASPKEKQFEPIDLGWRMVRHELPPQNLAYKLFGRKVGPRSPTSCRACASRRSTRAPHRGRPDRNHPITDETTEVHQIFWATPRWFAPLAPLLKPFMHTFLGQDRHVVVQQREGLVHKPKLMLINDADTQARWWMRVKDEWIAAERAGRAFVNPLEPKTLRWRS